jgi:hypothetical protein
MTKDEALHLALEALEKLWGIIDDIDTYGDMAKADEKLYRTLVERRQRQRFEETGISTDGYELHGGAITAIKAALEAKDEPWEQFYPEMGKPKIAYLPPTKSPENACYIPPQRTWVGLTDEEIALIDWESLATKKDCVRAIEAAHGIAGEKPNAP